MFERYDALATATAVCFAVAVVRSPPSAAEVVRAVEYYHQAFEHYFVTANPVEIAALDSGAVSGWWRTGQRYRVDDVPAEGLVPVCRFYTAAYAGKASHFFTASAAECEHVKTMPYWTYEGVAFYARVPDADGKCAAGTASINRLFNSGQGGAPNHAYTADGAKRDKLVSAGWTSEGVAYCAQLATADPLAQTLVLAGAKWDFPDTEIYDHEIVGSYRLATSFLPTANVSPNGSSLFSSFGLPLPTASVDFARSATYGAAAWDPLAGSYVVLAGSDFWGTFRMEWTFENAQGPTASVCAMTGYLNFGKYDRRTNGYPLHPFQPILFTGCAIGVAYRS
jgi:hypothetical protein